MYIHEFFQISVGMIFLFINCIIWVFFSLLEPWNKYKTKIDLIWFNPWSSHTKDSKNGT